ncbi:MAG: 16S rRNA (cytosine(1402)-N(4))-methyltransferase RsmH, partial [Candidatus Marinimicrobia bacterium]|nr:16S rRNA (cytosine(1402)-N(4))-methyltransferase RsmH [Candidatus Neomarinimicrobiota bacterium]
HSKKILENIDGNGKVFGFEVDPKATAKSSELCSNSSRFKIIENNFDKIKVELYGLGIYEIDGILYDLGTSNLELNDNERGFSFSKDGLLDMRMDPTLKNTAENVVNNYPLEKLTEIFFNYGEERMSKQIAREIVKIREETKIDSTKQLKDIISKFSNQKYRNKALARIFQAIRIEVNNELEVLEKSLNEAIKLLKIGGRLVVISYHSLEDRIVKKIIQKEIKDCICPPEIPICVCNHKATLKKINTRIITPTLSEIKTNSQSRSAKLRVAEKI